MLIKVKHDDVRTSKNTKPTVIDNLQKMNGSVSSKDSQGSSGASFFSGIADGFRGPAFKLGLGSIKTDEKKSTNMSKTLKMGLVGARFQPTKDEPTYEVGFEQQDIGVTFETEPFTKKVCVRGVARGSVARQQGLIRRGDVLVAVNGQVVFDDAFDQVMQLLQHLRDTLATRTLRFLRPSLCPITTYQAQLASVQGTRDPWGFRRPLDYLRREARVRAATQEKQAQRDAEWVAFLKTRGGVHNLKIPGMDNDDDGGPLLKSLVRRGVPQAFRGPVWMVLSGAADIKSTYPPNYYLTMLEQSADIDPKVRDDIEKDIDRTFPEHAFFETEHGANSLRRLLLAFAAHDVEISYCQSLNFLAGMLLLFCAEEDAFWLLHTITHELLPRDYYASNLAGIHVDQHVLAHIVKAKMPSIDRLMTKFQVQLPMVTVQWFLCLYVNSLPVETALRVWDVFFNEGEGANSKVLFRVAVALLKLYQPMLQNARDNAELYGVLREVGKDMFDADTLLSNCYKNYDGGLRVRLALYKEIGFSPQKFGADTSPITPAHGRRRSDGTQLSNSWISFSRTSPQSSFDDSCLKLNERTLRMLDDSSTPSFARTISRVDSSDQMSLGFGDAEFEIPTLNATAFQTPETVTLKKKGKVKNSEGWYFFNNNNNNNRHDSVPTSPPKPTKQRFGKRQLPIDSSKIVKAKVMRYNIVKSKRETLVFYKIHVQNQSGEKWAVFRRHIDFERNYNSLKSKIPDFETAGFSFPEDFPQEPDFFNNSYADFYLKRRVQSFNEYIQIIMTLGTIPLEFTSFVQATKEDMANQPDSTQDSSNNFFRVQSTNFLKSPSLDRSFNSLAPETPKYQNDMGSVYSFSLLGDDDSVVAEKTGRGKAPSPDEVSESTPYPPSEGSQASYAWQLRGDRSMPQKLMDKIDARGFYRKDIERWRSMYRPEVYAMFEGIENQKRARELQKKRAEENTILKDNSDIGTESNSSSSLGTGKQKDFTSFLKNFDFLGKLAKNVQKMDEQETFDVDSSRSSFDSNTSQSSDFHTIGELQTIIEPPDAEDDLDMDSSQVKLPYSTTGRVLRPQPKPAFRQLSKKMHGLQSILEMESLGSLLDESAQKRIYARPFSPRSAEESTKPLRVDRS